MLVDVLRKKSAEAKEVSVSVPFLQVALLGPARVVLAFNSLHQCLAAFGRVALQLNASNSI